MLRKRRRSLRRQGHELLESRTLLAGDLVGQWVAEDLVSTVGDGEAIPVWTDRISGINALPLGTPKLAHAALDGKGTVRFQRQDGADSFVVAAADSPMSGAEDYTIAVGFATNSQTLNGGMSAWFLNTGLVDGTGFFGTTADWGVVINTDGQIGAGLGQPATTVYSSVAELNDGLYHLAVVTRRGDTLTIYVDGQQVGTQSGVGTDPRLPLDMTFGAVSRNTFAYSGDIAEIRIYNDDLEGDELTDLFTELRTEYSHVAPDAFPEDYTATEEVELTIDAAQGVLANDVNLEPDPMVARLITTTSHGDLLLNEDGSFRYLPDPDYFGPDSFTYVADNTADSKVVTVTLTVDPVYDPPAAFDDAYLVASETAFSTTAENGVQANDRNADAVTITSSLIEDVDHGTLALRADGSFDYTSDPGFTGTDQFSYRSTDGTTPTEIVTVQLVVVSEPLIISEVQAAGGGSFTSRVRPSPTSGFPGPRIDFDWIEIQNLTTEAIDLEGKYLTDDDNDLQKWQFPAGSLLPPQGTLVVYASGANVLDPELDERGIRHTNFRLSGDGEYVGLIDADGTVIHEYAPDFPQQVAGVSYGLSVFAANPQYFQTPTPGEINGQGELDILAPPTISVGSRLFQESFQVTLTPASPLDQIRYTLDTSVPTQDSPLYLGPIEIGASTQLRASSFREGFIPSLPASESYTKFADDLTDFESNLPLLVIDTFGNEIPGTNTSSNANAFAAIFEPQANGSSSLTNIADVATRAGIRERGSSSSGFDKKPFALELWQEGTDADNDQSLAGLPADADWVLLGPWTFDRTFTRNALPYDLSNQIGRYAARTSFIEVFVNEEGPGVDLSFAGHYNGVYVLVEKLEFSPDRLDVDPVSLTARDESEIGGGYLLKVDRSDPGESGFSAGGESRLQYVSPKEIDIELNADQQAFIANYIDDFAAALNAPDYLHPTLGLHYSEFIDVASWVDHFWINELALNVDALRLSAYLFKPRDGKLEAGPVWDFDRSLESAADDRDDDPRRWYFQIHGDLVPDWWRRLLDDLEYRQALIDRWQELRAGAFGDVNLHATMDRLTAEVGTEAAERNFARWTSRPPRTSGPGVFDPGLLDGSWQGEIAHQKAWLDDRTAWLDGFFLDRAAIDMAAAEAGLLSLSGPSGAELYYTLDGSDPRLQGGGIAPAALRYTGPVQVAPNSLVTVRAHDPAFPSAFVPFNGFLGFGGDTIVGNEEWSGPVSTRIAAATPAEALRISELHYHPADPSAAEQLAGFDDGDLFEFLELVNISNTTVDLEGVELTRLTIGNTTQGVAFAFNGQLAPGQRLVVVENLAAFTHRYGDSIPVAGAWAGGLSNNRETLTLTHHGHTIQQFTYDDDWHPTTDGDGPSLEIIDAHQPDLTTWQLAAGWRPSEGPGGTPSTGTANPSLGDIDTDGDTDADDIDRLYAGLYGGESGPPFDLTNDGRVDQQDVEHLVESLLDTQFGDADLDGVVTADNDGQQLLASLSQGLGRGWRDGDFNGDRRVTASEDGAALLAALAGDQAAASAPSAPVTTIWESLFSAPDELTRRSTWD